MKYEDIVTLLENVRVEGKGILTQHHKDELDSDYPPQSSHSTWCKGWGVVSPGLA